MDFACATGILKQWHASMDAPINHKKAKYCKAVERIINSPPSCYVACEYKDADVIFDMIKNDMFTELDVEIRYRSEAFSVDDKNVFWGYIKELNRCALVVMGAQMQYVPTREEIQENIRRHKQQRTSHMALLP